ncbi:organic cation transporter protein-like [Actinia tenebrosa]|uniref:Organic cation transporter protein-like n=1 Tax=Actinia tenebrosa TaxID=6105 RepID=A0A6P8ISA5_ACTTE|nr:organic cation transporter protein-like [Actinia tenebrosa]
MGEKDNNSSSSSIEFDDVFQLVNSFGRYQKAVYFGSCILVLLMAFPFGMLVFGFAAPSFQCNTPNITCPQKTCCDNCTSYSFDKAFTSTVTEWHLICGRASLNAAIQTSMYVGMLFGDLICGRLSDTFGRKKCIFIYNGIMVIFGFASSFSNSVPLMAVLWFVMGIGLTGLVISQYIYFMEIVGPKYRTMAGNVYELFWAVGFFISTLLAYFTRDWRNLCMISTAPGALLYLFWRIFPESPRWLVAHDHLEEANFILLKYGGRKNQAIDEERLKNVIARVRQTQRKKVFDLQIFCRTPKIRKWSAALGYNWFASTFLNTALFLYVSNLSGNIYLNFTILQVITALKQPILWIVLKTFGRRIPHAMVMFLIGILCLLLLAIPDKYHTIKTGLFMTASGITYCLWTTTFMITCEIYPTVVRNTAQATGSCIGRIGAIAAPFVAMLGRTPGTGLTVPMVVFAVISLTAGAISLFVPETLFTPMHQTIEEAEAATDDYGIPCCGKPGNKSSKTEVGLQQSLMDTQL